MGQSIDAKLMVGMEFNELCNHMERQEILDLIDSGDLDYASPYYDSPPGMWFVGIDLGCQFTVAKGQVFGSGDAVRNAFDKLNTYVGKTNLVYTLRACADVT